MFQAAGWILIITVLSANTNTPTTPGMNIQIEGFKTEGTCLKAGKKAKQDITKQVIEHYAEIKGEEMDERFGAFIIPIAICVKKD
jgi:hypothetical protein